MCVCGGVCVSLILHQHQAFLFSLCPDYSCSDCVFQQPLKLKWWTEAKAMSDPLTYAQHHVFPLSQQSQTKNGKIIDSFPD